MLQASIKNDSYETHISDGHGKELTICSSRVGSPYLSPRQLVQGALAGCLAMTLRRTLADHAVRFRDVRVLIEPKEDAEKTTFLYSVSIDSDEDPDRLDELTQEAVSSCYIHDLLAGGITLEQADLLNASAGSERCCE